MGSVVGQAPTSTKSTWDQNKQSVGAWGLAHYKGAALILLDLEATRDAPVWQSIEEGEEHVGSFFQQLSSFWVGSGHEAKALEGLPTDIAERGAMGVGKSVQSGRIKICQGRGERGDGVENDARPFPPFGVETKGSPTKGLAELVLAGLFRE